MNNVNDLLKCLERYGYEYDNYNMFKLKKTREQNTCITFDLKRNNILRFSIIEQKYNLSIHIVDINNMKEYNYKVCNLFELMLKYDFVNNKEINIL